MKDVQVLVFNNARTLCAVGELGELYLRSPHLAKGYMALEGQSDAKFIVNPFTGVSWDRLYRTGDLGRYLPDGVAEWYAIITSLLELLSKQSSDTHWQHWSRRRPSQDSRLPHRAGRDQCEPVEAPVGERERHYRS